MVKFVVIESPYAGKNPYELQRNLDYVRAAMADCFKRGEVPFPSHALYTQPGVLDDTKPEQRKQGIQAGFDVAAALFVATKARPEEFSFVRAFYVDRGLSRGMVQGEEDALAQGQYTTRRSIGDEWSKDRDPKFRPAGWSYPGSFGKAHFFPEGEIQSACGKWLFDGERTSGLPFDRCAVCGAKLAGFMGGVKAA